MDKNIYCQFEKYLKTKDYSKQYLNPLKHFLLYCQSNNLDYLKLNYSNFTDFIIYIKNGHENGYVNNFLNSLRCFYRFLEDSGLIGESQSKNELLKIKYLKVPKKIRHHINFEELEKLIRLCVNFNYCVPYKKLKAILFFMFFTGLRKGEIVTIQRKDINLNENVAIVRIPNKSKKERLAYFTPLVSETLKDYFATEAESINAFNMTYKQIEGLFDFMKKFDKEIKPHTMKHSFAQLLMDSGVDIKICQSLLGHANLSTTEIYCNPSNTTISNQYKTKIG